MRSQTLCNFLKLAAKLLFSPAGGAMEVMDLEGPEPKPLGPIYSPYHPYPRKQGV